MAKIKVLCEEFESEKKKKEQNYFDLPDWGFFPRFLIIFLPTI